MCHQIQSIDIEREIMKRKIKTLELKSTITEVKSSPEGLISRFEPAEERICQLEDGLREIM